MKHFFLIALTLLTSTGCSQKTNSVLDRGKLKAFLKGSDRLVVKRFFPAKTLQNTVPQTAIDGVVRTTWLPGTITIEPIVATEPNGLKQTYKGARLSVVERNYEITSSYSGETTRGKSDSHVSVLDESELRDMDEAITYMLGVAETWRKDAPKVTTEIAFQTVDELSVDAGISKDGPGLSIRSGDIGGASEVLTLDKARQFQAQLREVITVLDAN